MLFRSIEESTNVINALYISDIIIESNIDTYGDDIDAVVESTLSDAFVKFKKAVEKFFNKIYEFLKGIVKKVKDFFMNATKYVSSYEKEIAAKKMDRYEGSSTYDPKDPDFKKVAKTLNVKHNDLEMLSHSAVSDSYT